MDESVRELLASLFHFPAGIMVESVHPSTNDLVIRVSCRNPSMACPDCHQPSYRIHSHYQRTVADVPCAGRNVILALTVRKFVCHTPGCPHRIFTERLPELVLSYARLTRRLTWLLQITGLATGGELGTRLSERHGIATTPTTLLRHLMKYPSRKAHPVRVLGVDDWSWKKGRRYGTLLVDLERREIIDVLEDRESATFAVWLLEHPEVEIVSRDRASQYAAAARKAAPQARQVADRFHLVRNLVDTLELLLARCRVEIRQEGQEPSPEDEPLPEEPVVPLPSSPQVWRQHPTERAERAYEAHRIEREDRYRQIAALHAQGMKQAEIAKLVGVSTYQVRTWLKQGGAPVHRRPCRTSEYL